MRNFFQQAQKMNRKLMRARLIWGLFLLLLCANNLAAQSVRIFVNHTEFTTDDNLILSVEIRDFKGSQIPRPRWPQVNGFQTAGTSTQNNWVNGRVSMTFSRTYVPTKPGTFKMPAVKYVLNGKNYAQEALTLKVKKGTGRRAQPQTRNPFDDFFGRPRRNTQPQDIKFKEVDADYFMSVNLDQDTAFVGEQVRGEVVLYINERDRGKVGVDGQAIIEMQQRIKNSGFWQEIIEFKDIPNKRVEINGKLYTAWTLYRTILFPLQPGKIAFKDIYLDGKKLMVATNASPFDMFFGQNTKFEAIRIPANQRTLYVKQLPETDLPRANMVGKFKMTAEVNNQNVNTGDNLELKVNIKGNGNIAMMPEPVTAIPEAFEYDAPNSEYASRTTENAFYGEKEFVYYLVPTRSGNYDLGPLKFFFLDPKTQAYDSLVIESIPVNVTGDDLDNLVLKKSGLDSYYETAMRNSDDKLRSDQASPSWLFFAILAMLGAAIVFRSVRKKDAPAPPEDADDWRKRYQ